MSYKPRLALYRMLAKMTKEPAMIPIYDAIMELQTLELHNNKKTSLWYVYQDLIEQMRNSDADFAQAIAKFVPKHDAMIIASTQEDDITHGFNAVIDNNQHTNAMKQAFAKALAYPLTMLALLLGLLYYFSIKVIPAFTDSIPANALLSPSSVFLERMANSFNWWFSLLLIVLVATTIFSVWALPNFVHRYRIYLETIIPFNIYRIMTGCSFLVSLNSLGRSGFMQIDALHEMTKLANPYLKQRIHIIMDLMAEGLDIGQALIHSGLNFPDKHIIKELAIQIKYSDDDSLQILSTTLVTDGLEAINQQAQSLRLIITLFVFAVIGFLYFAVYQFGMDIGNTKI